MSSIVKKLIGEITSLAFEITNKTKHDVFARYEGHVNAIIISYHDGGYYSGSKEVEILELWMNSEKYHISKLKKAKRKLKKLLEES